MDYYAFHYDKGRLPNLSEERKEAIKKGIEVATAKSQGVVFQGAMFHPSSGTGVFHFQASSRSDIMDILDSLAIPYDTVDPVFPL